MPSRNVYGATGLSKLGAPVSEVYKSPLYAFERTPWTWNPFLQTQDKKKRRKGTYIRVPTGIPTNDILQR